MVAEKQGTGKWDAEVDVVVVGFGGAGACAALEAAQRGASVLVLDRFHRIADGSSIENLYAAGRNAVGLCSNVYFASGTSIADCVLAGRRAGAHAAGRPAK